MKKTITTDVLVIGAGASGIPAAVAAAREGAKVVLLEEDSVIGGGIVDMYVAMLCGGPVTGFWLEMRTRLERDYKLLPGHTWFLPSHWLMALEEAVSAEKNITLYVGAHCKKSMRDDSGKVLGGIVKHGSETLKIEAAVTIDATGTGIFSEKAGCQIMYGRDARSTFGESLAPETADDQVQMVTQMYISQKLPGVKHFDMSQLENAKLGVLVSEFGWFHWNPEESLKRNLGLYLHWGCAVRCRDTRDSIAIADAQREALKAASKDLNTLRENGYAVHLAPKLGVREVRRVVGECVITQDHLTSGAHPADTIAVCGYGLDVWGEDTSKTTAKRYGIPIGALIPKGVSGMLVTGKCASGSHIAMSSYRVIPVVGSMGQAAGVAAALSALNKTEVRNLDVSMIRERLVEPQHGLTLEV